VDSDLRPPPELVKLGHRFFRHDYSWGIKDFDSWAKYAINSARLSDREREVIKGYLERITQVCDNVQLDDIWHMIGTAVVIATPGVGGARHFFTAIHNSL
jgi:hypothetical protein